MFINVKPKQDKQNIQNAEHLYLPQIKYSVVVLGQNKHMTNYIAHQIAQHKAFRIHTAHSIADAVRLQKWTHIDCIFFDRSLELSLDAVFQHFNSKHIRFVPVAKHQDDYDIINSINSHRCCYYIAGEITRDKVKEAISCLQHDNTINTPY